MDFTRFQQCTRLLIEQVGCAVSQIVLVQRQIGQIAAEHNAARLFLAMGDLHLDRIVQRNRLHHHFNRMIAVVAAAGHIQRQIDLRERSRYRAVPCYNYMIGKHDYSPLSVELGM